MAGVSKGAGGWAGLTLGSIKAEFGNSQASPTSSFRVQIRRSNQEDHHGPEQPPECHSFWGQSTWEKISTWQAWFTLSEQEWFMHVPHGSAHSVSERTQPRGKGVLSSASAQRGWALSFVWFSPIPCSQH